MIINVALTLQEADDKSMTADAAADAILKALDGNPKVDTCTVTMFVESKQGQAGVAPAND